MTVKIKVKDKLEDDTLDLSCCDLEDVPVREIAAVKKGTHLDLSNNQLVRLPDTFATLSHIVKLDLSKNLLEDLPENIGELRQLKHLDLYSNKISRLPLGIAELKNLKWLDLKDNPLSNVLASLAGPCGDNEQCQECAHRIVSYYNDVKLLVAEQKELAAIVAAAEERKREAARKRRRRRKNAAKENMNAADDTEKESDHKSKRSNGDEDDEEDDQASEKQHLSEKVIDDKPVEDGLCNTFCRKLAKWSVKLFIWISSLLYFVIFVLLVFTILSKYNEIRLRPLTEYLESRTALPVKHYQKEAVQKLDLLLEYTENFVNRAKILARDTYERHFGEEEPVNTEEF